MSRGLRQKLLKVAALHEELGEAYMELADVVAVNQLEEAVDEVEQRVDVQSSQDLVLARWVVTVLRESLADAGIDRTNTEQLRHADLSVKTVTERLRERCDVPGLSARRVGYVVRTVIGLKTKRMSRWNGRRCVVYDADVVDAWEERYGG